MSNIQDQVLFSGILKKKIFQGDGGYLIAAVEDIDANEEKIIVGYLSLLKDQIYEFKTNRIDHDRYGEQYNVSSYKMKVPDEGEGLINFLSSSSFKNIGKRTAKKIVDEFKEKTIDVIKTEPDKLIELGISEANVETLYNNLVEVNGMEEIYKILNPLGFSEFYINEIYRYLKIEKINFPSEFLKKNPYKLAKDIEAINFNQADKIFMYYNDNEKDDYRIQNAINYAIADFCQQTGNTYTNMENLQISLIRLLGFEVDDLDAHLEKLSKDDEVIIEGDIIALDKFYQSEKAIARNILNRINFLNLGLDENDILPEIMKIEKSNGINYSDLQKQAITNSLTNNISIITGGPGTGKTTIIDAVVKIFQKIKYDDKVIKNIEEKIILCAPTGRAAQRMKETTRYESRTIHSLLEWDPYKNEFNRDLENNLPQDLIIIDEFSMVDIFLAEHILKAVKPDSIVVIVGDSAQLESVNPGNVLEDLIASKKIPLVHLDLIFRQGEGSSIAELAKNIDENKKIEIVNTKDMSVIERNSELPSLVKNIVEKSYDAGYDEMEVQILYPKYSGRNGIDSLNKVLLPNLDRKFIIFGDKKYYLGDKVMQLKNNYEKNIYNGDIGIITQVYSENSGDGIVLEVTFKERKISFTRKDLIDLTHAYAISIHKSQGSEFKVIILPVSSEAQNMLSKKLLYTAITRAKEKLVIIGDMDCFKDNVQKVISERATLLQQFFQSIS